MGRKLTIDPRQIEHRCNRTHLAIVRHHLLEAERIKQLPLILPHPTHHGPFPPLTASTSGNHCSRKPSTDFCNKIGTKQTQDQFARNLRLKQSGHEAKATAYQVRVRATTPAMICIITPTTHPSRSE